MRPPSKSAIQAIDRLTNAVLLTAKYRTFGIPDYEYETKFIETEPFHLKADLLEELRTQHGIEIVQTENGPGWKWSRREPAGGGKG